jgi:hypothetical protein
VVEKLVMVPFFLEFVVIGIHPIISMPVSVMEIIWQLPNLLLEPCEDFENSGIVSL